MTISMSELQSILTDCMTASRMEALRALEPSTDKLRLADVKAWLRLNNIEYRQFKKLEKAGLIATHRTGASRNSPLIYSKTEIRQALAAATIARYQQRELINKEKEE